MKKHNVTISFMLCLSILTACSGCGLGLLERVPNNSISSEVSGETELFSPAVLEYYEIPWLVEPEHVGEVTQYFDTTNYNYETTVTSEEVFWLYSQSILTGLLEGDYSVGYFLESGQHGELWTAVFYNVLVHSENLQDYVDYSETNNSIEFRIYYTVLPVGEYDEQHDGYPLREIRKFIVNLTRTANQEGTYQLKLYLGTSGHEIDYLRIDEDTSEEVEAPAPPQSEE